MWALHQLDILRKHERLIAVSAVIPAGDTGIRSVPFEDKTDLGILPPGTSRDEAERDTSFTLQITLNEPRVGLANAPVIPTLRRFAARARAIINEFN